MPPTATRGIRRGATARGPWGGTFVGGLPGHLEVAKTPTSARREKLRDGGGLVKRGLEEEVSAQYIELLVICDKGMILKHRGHRDIEHWVLTLFGVVKSFYSESSMTFIIQPVLVRIIYLEKEEEEIDLEISKNFRTTMPSVCKWGNALQPTDPTHPNHFDLMVFISK
ncbi:hypothetical protein HUJ05_011131 [Dendroctonus ponderosae]|nr:hypothetical protein HUJ05_011131 [Dendroctonus ponderosae]